jgi:hypothetical protein
LSDSAPPASPEVPAVAVPPAGFDGFLGTRASIGMDVLLVGLLATLPVLVLSIAAVRARRYAVHKALQLGIVAALLAAIVVLFAVALSARVEPQTGGRRYLDLAARALSADGETLEVQMSDPTTTSLWT